MKVSYLRCSYQCLRHFSNPFILIDSRRNRKMVYQRRHARSKKTSSFNEKGLRGLKDIGKYFTTFSH